MACLSKEQIDFVRSNLKNRDVSRSFLFDEWIDHVCCDVESLMNRGMDFEEAFSRVTGDPETSGIRSAHHTIHAFLNHRYVGIKKLLMFAFAVFALSWLINVRYGSHWIGLASFLILSFVYLRISVDFFHKRYLSGLNILLSSFSFLSFLGTSSGMLLIFLFRNFDVQTRGHGVDLTVFGWFFFSLLCLIYYARESRLAIENSEVNRLRWFARLAASNVFLAAISIASFPLFSLVRDYIFFLILFILGFNVLVFMILLFTKSINHTLAISLIIGSFMIVFIHSPFRAMLPGGKKKVQEISLRQDQLPMSNTIKTSENEKNYHPFLSIHHGMVEFPCPDRQSLPERQMGADRSHGSH
jgi:hypothetical protein